MVSINQLSLQKNKAISINQLRYKAPEKSHATAELVGYTYTLKMETVCLSKHSFLCIRLHGVTSQGRSRSCLKMEAAWSSGTLPPTYEPDSR